MLNIVFMGSPDFAVPSLRTVMARHRVVLVMSQPDKPAGRGKKLTSPAVAEVARAAGIEVYQPRSARAPEVAERLAHSGADLAVVIAYGKILPLAVLEAFPRGCVNVHASVLPAYRGAAPIQWSIIRGERETGVTIMQLDEGMDTGPTLAVQTVAIDPADTAGMLSQRLATVGAKLLVETLDEIEQGRAVATPQDHQRATYAPMLDKSTGVVDWQQSAQTVANLIRGVDPWPGASTTLADASLKLFGARVATGAGSPGTILEITTGGAIIACGEGAVSVAELQLPGKRRMAASEVARGRALGPGTVLGS